MMALLGERCGRLTCTYEPALRLYALLVAWYSRDYWWGMLCRPLSILSGLQPDVPIHADERNSDAHSFLQGHQCRIQRE